jgi:hypothetical protein
MNPKRWATSSFASPMGSAWEIPHIVGPVIGTSSSSSAAAQPGRFRSVVVGSGAPRFRPTTTTAEHRAGAPGQRQRMMCRVAILAEGDRRIIDEKSSGTVVLGDTARNVMRR